MSEIPVRRALISVYDKSGIVDFARALHGEFGIEIISTGGTAELLRENDIPVTLVEEITGFPEMLDGRVKTLHPKIHAAILADRDNPEHMRQLAEQDIRPIDMVVVNLYPFEETVRKPDCTFDEAIEMIDIGGPCLLRAAAKNHKYVWIILSPDEYRVIPAILEGTPETTAKFRKIWAGATFRLIRTYDQIIDWYLSGRSIELMGEKRAEDTEDEPSAFLHLNARRERVLRYGENPHQTGGLYITQCPDEASVSYAQVKTETGEVSFNNYADADTATELCKELTRGACNDRNIGRAACVYVKHQNACGVGIASSPLDAYRLAYLGDPHAAIGGVLAVNFPVDAAFAEAVVNSLDRWGREAGAGAFFVEVWAAPAFDEKAIRIIQSGKPWGKRTRLLSVGDMSGAPDESELDLRRITGGLLVQSRDMLGLDEKEKWKTVTERGPTDAEMTDLRLAWLVCKHTKSNAISICRDGMLIGNGAGQASRVMSCRIATWLANENGHAEKLKGAVAASDAFFPFRDGPDLLIEAGVTAIIQPGGSKRDEETIAACNERDVAMIFTGTRHFKH